MTAALLVQMALAALIAGVVTLGTTPLARKLAFAAGVVKHPRDRDVHTTPTPSWGGIAIVLGLLAAFVGLRLFGPSAVLAPSPNAHLPEPLLGIAPRPILGIVLGGILIALVGIADDRFDLSPKWQVLGLVLPGLVAAVMGARIVGVSNPLPGLIHVGPYLALGWMSVPLTMAWVFLATKTFDFLDGLDGLASGVGAIAATTMGLIACRQGEPVVALLAAATAGASLGFLRWNYQPASIFMGSVGSYVLGYVLSMLAVVGTLKVPAAVSVFLPLMVLGVPVFDGLYVTSRRLARGQRPTAADKTHIHHRLTQRGLSVRQAVWTIYGLTAGACLCALALAWAGSR